MTNAKVNLIKSEKKKLKNKDFPWYPGFRLEPYAQKRELLNRRYESVASKKQLRCSSNHINLNMI